MNSARWILANLFILFLFLPLDRAFAKNEFEHWLAVSTETQEFTSLLRGAVHLTLDDLIAKGRRKIGNLDLVQLNKEVSQVQWRYVKKIPIQAGPLGSRPTATYSVKEKLVILSLEQWNEAGPSFRALIALHEALGALGYGDEKYQISLLIANLSTLENWDTITGSRYKDRVFPNAIEQMIRNNQLGKSFEKRDFTIAGVSGVGGGGDYVMAGMKMLLTNFSYVYWAEHTDKRIPFSTFYQVLLESEIERNGVRGEGRFTLGQAEEETFVSYTEGLQIVMPNHKGFYEALLENSLTMGQYFSLVYPKIYAVIPK